MTLRFSLRFSKADDRVLCANYRETGDMYLVVALEKEGNVSFKYIPSNSPEDFLEVFLFPFV